MNSSYIATKVVLSWYSLCDPNVIILRVSFMLRLLFFITNENVSTFLTLIRNSSGSKHGQEDLVGRPRGLYKSYHVTNSGKSNWKFMSFSTPLAGYRNHHSFWKYQMLKLSHISSQLFSFYPAPKKTSANYFQHIVRSTFAVVGASSKQTKYPLSHCRSNVFKTCLLKS